MHGLQPGQRVTDDGQLLFDAGSSIGALRGIPDGRGKRLFDICFSLLALFLLIPAFVIIGLAVKASSPGPVFFRQVRYGYGERLFTIYKFRTMDHRPVSRDVLQTQAGDPRLTPIGAFLRRTSLDELPQFFNVLKGDMSVVGPRPHAPRTMIGAVAYEDVARDYAARHAVRPGVTGLAQINGFRGPIQDVAGARKRFEMDLAYVGSRSLKLDAQIIWRTIVSEFVTGTGL